MDAIRLAQDYLAALLQRHTSDQPAQASDYGGLENTDGPLARLCAIPDAQPGNKVVILPSTSFTAISTFLVAQDELAGRRPPDRWSSRPRLYTVLKAINALDLMPRFTKGHFNDLSLPFDDQTLPTFVKGTDVRLRFLLCQRHVLSEAHDIEAFRAGTHSLKHVHLSGSADEHFERRGDLGSGTFGTVDHVISKLSFREYARKTVARGKDSATARQRTSTVATEIATLTKLSHVHLVRIAGSYTDREHIAYLMTPVADRDLERWLEALPMLPNTAMTSTKYFFGCLAGAMQYLYASGIRHRDLKPTNILVKDNRVYIADFGNAVDFASSGRSTTQSARAGTEAFWSPEQAKRLPRNNKSEMWALGLVYLHIITALKGSSPKKWQQFLSNKARVAKTEPTAYANVPAVTAWLGRLVSNGAVRDVNEAVEWARDLLNVNPDSRPSAQSLVQSIFDSPFMQNFCCPLCRADAAKPTSHPSQHPYIEDEVQRIPYPQQRDRKAVRENVDMIKGSWVGGRSNPTSKSSRSIETWLREEPSFAPPAYDTDAFHTLNPTRDPRDQTSILPEWIFDSPIASDSEAQPLKSTSATRHRGIYDADAGFFVHCSDASDSEISERGNSSSPPIQIIHDDVSDVSEQMLVEDRFAQSGELLSGSPPIHVVYEDDSDDSDFGTDESKIPDIHYNHMLRLEKIHEEIEVDASPLDPTDRFAKMPVVRFKGSSYAVSSHESNLWSTTPGPSTMPVKLIQSTHDAVEAGSGGWPLSSTSEPQSQDDTWSLVDKPQTTVSDGVLLSPFVDRAGGQPSMGLGITPEQPGHHTPPPPYTSHASQPGTSISGTAPASSAGYHCALHSASPLPPVPYPEGHHTSYITDMRGFPSTLRLTGSEDRHASPTKARKGSKKRRDSAKVSISSPPKKASDAEQHNRKEHKAEGNPTDIDQSSDPLEDTPMLKTPIFQKSSTSKGWSRRRFATSTDPLSQKPFTVKHASSRRRQNRAKFELDIGSLFGLDAPPDPKKKLSTRKLDVLSFTEGPHVFKPPSEMVTTDNASEAMPEAKAYMPARFIENAWKALDTAESVATTAMDESSRKMFAGMSKFFDRDTLMLERCCKAGMAAGVKHLIEKRCNPGTVTNRRPKPLVLAIKGHSQKHYKCAKALIMAGCDVNAEFSGTTPLLRAIDSPPYESRSRLLATLLVRGGADTNKAGSDGDVPLLKVFAGLPGSRLEEYKIETLVLLLHPRLPIRPDINATQPVTGNTALHLAVRRRSPEAVAMLIHRDADVNAVNASGISPLLLAANQWEGELEDEQAMILEYLLEMEETDVNAKAGSPNASALHQAVRAGAPLAVEMLLERGADVNILDDTGRSPMDWLEKHHPVKDSLIRLSLEDLLLRTGDSD